MQATQQHSEVCDQMWQSCDYICKCDKLNLKAPQMEIASSPEMMYFGSSQSSCAPDVPGVISVP